jgi:hypothetical protein
MDDRPKERNAGRAVALVLFAALALYLLSIGPAHRLHRQGYIGTRAMLIAYAPILWLADTVPSCVAALDWYCLEWKP